LDDQPSRLGSKLSDAEKAMILSHAATCGVLTAAKAYGLNRKSVQRYKRELDSGSNPELSRLVAIEASKASDRNRSKMQRAIDVLLDRVIETAPNATITEATGSLEKIGDLFGSWKVMGVKPDSEGEEASSHAGLGGRAKGGAEERPPVH
jgi:hypothetical protein